MEAHSLTNTSSHLPEGVASYLAGRGQKVSHASMACRNVLRTLVQNYYLLEV